MLHAKTEAAPPPWAAMADPDGRARPSWAAPRRAKSVAPRADLVTILPAPSPVPTRLTGAPQPSGSREATSDVVDLRASRDDALEKLEGLTLALAKAEDERDAARVALASVTASATRERRRLIEDSERDLVELSIEIAKRVVGPAHLAPEVFVAIAESAVLALFDRDEVVLAIAPDLAARVPEELWNREMSAIPRFIDVTLPSYGCEVRTKTSRVDASLRGRLDAVASTLGLDTP